LNRMAVAEPFLMVAQSLCDPTCSVVTFFRSDRIAIFAVCGPRTEFIFDEVVRNDLYGKFGRIKRRLQFSWFYRTEYWDVCRMQYTFVVVHVLLNCFEAREDRLSGLGPPIESNELRINRAKCGPIIHKNVIARHDEHRCRTHCCVRYDERNV